MLSRLLMDMLNKFITVGADFGLELFDGAFDNLAVVRAVFLEPFGGFGLVSNHIELIELNVGEAAADAFADANF